MQTRTGMLRSTCIVVATCGIAVLLLWGGCNPFCPPPTPSPEGEGTAEGTPEGTPEGEPEGAADGEGAFDGLCRADCSYEVINVFPHDPAAFTQGLVYVDGSLYEGTGLYGQSALREVDLLTGQVFRLHELDDKFFGEGITVFGDRVVQLTWRKNTGFVYDLASFDLVQEFSYPTEGWGITHDSEQLIMSDGTATLYFWNPETFAETGRVTVRDGSTPVSRLNELEYIRGEVYANVWQTDLIARIDPKTGNVLGWLYLDGLLDAGEKQSGAVLNGIAYDEASDRLFVTGKLWPKLFEIRLIPRK